MGTVEGVATNRQARPASERGGRVRWDVLEERFTASLLEGDEVAAHGQVARLHKRGVPVRAIIAGLFAPAGQTVGTSWENGSIGVAEEHRATAIMEQLLGELTPRVGGRRRGNAVVATWSGEHHTLPTTMAAAALREDRWHVDHLGSGVPASGLIRFVQSADPDLVALSVTLDEYREETEALARQLREEGIPVLVGGPGRTLDELCDRAVSESRDR